MKPLLFSLVLFNSTPVIAIPSPQDTNRYAQIGASLVAGSARKDGNRAAECQAAKDLQYYQSQDRSTPIEDIDWVAGIISRSCR
jgi:hypothetical protein